MLLLTNTLQEDFGVRYNPDEITPIDDPRGFDFTRSETLFINGLLNGQGGTCASMPVLYVAIGRRLGYPLKLVTSPDHYYLRWDDPETGERFNIEGTARGFASRPDEDYVDWPRKMSDAERDNAEYFKSLGSREELSCFLATRADCLLFSGMLADAHATYKKALELWPHNFPARYSVERTEKLLQRLKERQRNIEALRRAEAIIQRQQRRRLTGPDIVLPGMPTVRIPRATGSDTYPRNPHTVTVPGPVPFPKAPGPAPFPRVGGPLIPDADAILLEALGPALHNPRRDWSEAMKRRNGIRSPDGRLPPSPDPLLPPVPHRPGAYDEIFIDPLPRPIGPNGRTP